MSIPSPTPVATAPAVAAPAATGGDDRTDRVESRLKLGIATLIMLAALMASFTHMKDWTMAALPDGTSVWFGWANAVISELIPLSATLSLRRRLRQGKPLMSYSLVMLLAGAVLSLAAQLSAVGWDAPLDSKFLAALPALAFLLVSKLVMGDLDSGRKDADVAAERQAKAKAEAKRQAEILRAARAETAEAQRALAEIQARAEAEARRVQAEISAREAAEIRAAEAEGRAEIAERERAEISELAERDRAEISARAEAEIAREKQALSEALDTSRRAQERLLQHAQAAAAAEGRLAEAREAAERAAAARVHAEQVAATHVERVTTAAEQAEQGLRQALAEAQETARGAQATAEDLADELRTVQAQLSEAQAFAERQANRAARAEQAAEATEAARIEAVNDLEAARRRLARAQERAEISGPSQAEISRPVRAEISGPAGAETGRAAGRKSLAAVPAVLPENLPEVKTVRPQTVALVLAARADNPDATQDELVALTGISDRTIRKVTNAVPADVVDRVLALTDGRVAS